MKRLIVMRHAKSSWESGAKSDHERPLNHRGKRDAPRVAAELVRRNWEPQLVISSDSQRTRETFAGMAAAFSDRIEVQFSRKLYCADVNEIIALVSLVPDDLSSVMVLGHNPGWEHAVSRLGRDRIVMKTATAALLQIDSPDWNDAIRKSGHWDLVDVIYPRELADD